MILSNLIRSADRCAATLADIEAGLDGITARPRMFGSPESVESQALLLLSLRARLMGDGDDGVRIAHAAMVERKLGKGCGGHMSEVLSLRHGDDAVYRAVAELIAEVRGRGEMAKEEV